jgi:hypothetical protein
MKFTSVWTLTLFAVVFLQIPTQAHAHLPGQPPFTFVNGETAGYYPVGFSSLPDLTLPQDAAPGVYLVNTSLDLKLETAQMPFFPEEIAAYEFTWDLGDGSKDSGLELHHTYTTTGSKIVTIYSRDTRTKDDAQLLSTLYVNIVPTADYHIPQIAISVNGTRITDLKTDSISAAFTKSVILDASQSTVGSAPIVSYIWDLGNRQLAKDAKVIAHYDNLFSSTLPVVRITDKNGIFVDANIQINNTSLPGPDGSIPSTGSIPTKSKAPAALELLGTFGLVFSAIFALVRKRS